MLPRANENKRSSSTGNIRTSNKYGIPPATSETLQISSPSIALGIHNTRATERRNHEARIRVKVEPESPDNAIKTISPRIQHRDLKAEARTMKTEGPFSRHHTVRIKVEDKDSPETPQRYPSFTATWSKSPVRVPTPVAEQFYRSAIVKKEGEEASVSRHGLSLHSHTSGPSASSSYNRLAAKAFHDFDASHPASKIKTEAEPSTACYIPKGASRIKHEAQSPCPETHHQNSPYAHPITLHHEVPIKNYPSTDSSPALSRTRSHCTVAPTPELRSETDFSYLQPITPTPFSTPYGVANPYAHSPPSYYIPGSLLEGWKRRARWGHRNRRAKRALPVLQSRCVPPVGNADEDKGVEAEEGGHGGKCVWYKVPLGQCCEWIRGIKGKCERARKKKWWQRGRQSEYDVREYEAQRRRYEELFNARRGATREMGVDSAQDV
jgi:hypothetical protein